MTIDVNIPIKYINKVYRPFLNKRNYLQIFYGSGGSGKTAFIIQRYILDVLTTKGVNVLAMRKVASENHDTIFAEFQSTIYLYGLEKLFTINESRGNEKIVCKHNNNMIIFRGAKDERELEKVKGIKTKSGVITDLYLDEANEFTPNDIYQLFNVRLRGKSKVIKRRVMSFNPVNVNHWIKKQYFDVNVRKTHFIDGLEEDKIIGDYNLDYVNDDEITILKSTYLNNHYYGDSSPLLELKDRDYYYYQVYALGEWGDIDDALIFHNYVIHNFEIDKSAQVYSGQDWGFNDPAAFEQCYIRDQELYIFNEVYETGKTNRELIEMLDAYKAYSTIADSSEPARIKEFARQGFKYREAQKGNDSIKMGLDYLKRFKKIHIHKSNCPKIAKEFQLYKYKQVKRDGEMIVDDEPLDKNNHGIDAIRYALEPFWNVKRPQIKTNRRVF
jgi:phage terminase large subunit